MGITGIAYLAIALLAIAAVVLALRANIRSPNTHSSVSAKKPAAAVKSTSAKRNPYRAIAIATGENPCAAANDIAGQRFLMSERNVPPLPLPNCDAAKCACTYSHFEDRRDKDGDRRGPVGLNSELHRYRGQVEQRKTRGRRASDRE